MTRIACSRASTSSVRSAPRSASERSPRLPAASSARRSTTSMVGGRPLARSGSSTRRYRPARACPTLSTDGVADRAPRPRPRARPAGSRRPAPGAVACDRSCTRAHAPRRRSRGPGRPGARSPRCACRPRGRHRRRGSAATRRHARPHRAPNGAPRRVRRGPRGGGRRGAWRARSPGRARGPGGHPRATPRSPRRRWRSCHRR